MSPRGRPDTALLWPPGFWANKCQRLEARVDKPARAEAGSGEGEHGSPKSQS